MELFIKQKIASLTDKIDILDGDDQVVYQSKRNAPTIKDETHITDAAGTEVSYFYDNPLAMTRQYTMVMADGREYHMGQKGLHLNDDIAVEGLGWHLKSRNFRLAAYDIFDANGEKVASATLKPGIHRIYRIEVFDESDLDIVATLFVLMKHLIDRKQ
ncbi:MAG: hypothetical protein ACRC75_06190 [Olsenella sp.]